MRILVGTTAVKIPADRSRPVIQNLGPGDIYLDTDGDVDANSGLKLIPNAVYEFPTPGADSNIWVVASEADTDVRVIEAG
jgi:hypothetical protein